jgi:RNA polymerase sigma-54 factor
MDEPSSPQEGDSTQPQSEESTDEKDTVVDTDSEKIEDFERIDNLDDDYHDYMSRAEPFRRAGSDEPDRKLEAIKNTAAPPHSLHEHLTEQWCLVECTEAVKKAGSRIIDYIDERGYLTTRLEQLYNKDKTDFTIDDLKHALHLVQKLEPAGVGARDLKECLLIQMAGCGDDMSFEMRLISEHMDALLENRLPDIARKLKCNIEKINRSIEHISKFDTSPGLQVGQNHNHPITPDIIVESSDDSSYFTVRLADTGLPTLKLNSYYTKMAKDNGSSEKTKKFLQNNISSARWIIEAIEQRRSTLLKVTKAVVKYQHDFFEKGQLYLRPLPMSKVADEVGVHLATVSRAVAGKYIHCPWGTLPLRKFFSGGTKDDTGIEHSWEAIRVQLQNIIEAENKSKPLSDDQIRKKLANSGINNLARRTIAKYRKLLNIPPARLRKKY